VSRRRSRPRHTVTVTIAGEKHVLRSDAPPEYTRAVAEHVDHTVALLGDAQPLEPHRTAILAALFITDELFRVRKELDELRTTLDGRAADLAGRLERVARDAAPGAGEAAAEAAPEGPAPGEHAAANPPEQPEEREER
jgi:cell division protein ZapA